MAPETSQMFRFRSAKAENGTVIDEIDGMSPDQVKLLVERGLVFGTTFKVNGKSVDGKIIAASWEKAEEAAVKRALGEEIFGQLA
jgi:hypothetical protein